jgi:hypothetical protein
MEGAASGLCKKLAACTNKGFYGAEAGPVEGHARFRHFNRHSKCKCAASLFDWQQRCMPSARARCGTHVCLSWSLCLLFAALRLMEVRAAYSTTDFEWDQLQRLSVESIQKSNLQLMREAATASLQATSAAAAAAETSESAAVPLPEQPAAATTEQEQEQEKQAAQQQDQQEQPAATTSAVEAVSKEPEVQQAVAPGNSTSSSSSSSESADTSNTGKRSACPAVSASVETFHDCSHNCGGCKQLFVTTS